MDSIQLGKRIKEARLSKKMTQSDVVGNFITRNMLSQIESGTAFPSIKTLEYLSQVLEIPIQQLMPAGFGEKDADCENGENTTLLELLLGGKSLLMSKKYSDAVVIFERIVKEPRLYDEACALLAKAYLGQAVQFRKSDQLGQAAHAAKQAAKLSTEGLYANREVRTDALLLLGEISDEIADTMHVSDVIH